MLRSFRRLPTGRLSLDRFTGFVEFFFRRTDGTGDIFPDDAPFGAVDGPDPERVLVLGESNAVGLGVTSHQLGMAGHFARLLAARTRRGIAWSAIAVPSSRLHSVRKTVETQRELLTHTDVVVLLIGISDTLALTSTRSWTKYMGLTLDLLVDSVPSDATVLITLIPPMDNAGSISRGARFAAGLQARRFNRITRRLVSQRERCRTVPFPESLRQELWVPESREVPYVGMYSAWGAAAVSALLERPSRFA
jgi:hypothetical protein